jgi:hypothetical protein
MLSTQQTSALTCDMSFVMAQGSGSSVPHAAARKLGCSKCRYSRGGCGQCRAAHEETPQASARFFPVGMWSSQEGTGRCLTQASPCHSDADSCVLTATGSPGPAAAATARCSSRSSPAHAAPERAGRAAAIGPAKEALQRGSDGSGCGDCNSDSGASCGSPTSAAAAAAVVGWCGCSVCWPYVV